MPTGWLSRAFRLVVAMRRRVHLLGWRLGVPGAGRRYAVADDLWRTLRGRLPRYGATSSVTLGGERVLALVDGTASDEERRGLGLPTRSEQRREVDEENRRLATFRWSRPGLPAELDVVRVWRPVSAAELERRWADEGSPVWRDGDDLTFAHRAHAEEVRLVPGIQLPLWRVEGDLWAVTVRIRDLARAAVTYGFVVAEEQASPLHRSSPGLGVWRGPDAPAPPPRAEPLRGELRRVHLDSRALGTRRGLTVYLPPGLGPEAPALYLADGESAPGFAAVLEPAILAGAVPRFALVGIHAAPSTLADDARGREYLPHADPRRFEAHRRFFMEEVPAWAERQLAVARDPACRAVAGYSNGAVLASALGCRNPDRIGAVIAFSLGLPPPLHPGRRPTRHYLLAGTLEPGFRRATGRWAERLRAAGVEVEERVRVCGHDPLMWQEELPAAVRWAFGRTAPGV